MLKKTHLMVKAIVCLSLMTQCSIEPNSGSDREDQSAAPTDGSTRIKGDSQQPTSDSDNQEPVQIEPKEIPTLPKDTEEGDDHDENNQRDHEVDDNGTSGAGESKAQIAFLQQALPILEASCATGGCHTNSYMIKLDTFPFELEGSYFLENLTNREDWPLSEGAQQRAVFKAIVDAITSGYMPPGYSGIEPPSSAEVTILQDWWTID